ncbi:MAG: flagellar basal body rod protein FlgB [Alphaproteobacteria bacterium]|nr:flagellar basal body rod protein FlgB [Alphaproteobacteria bacterium]
MGEGNTDLVSAITSKMHWLAERQRLLAQNVANADTANFKPKDLAPFDFKSTLQQALVTPNVTHANHIIGGHGAKAGTDVVKAKTYETLPSGNAVNLETEMMKVSQTGMDYTQMSALLRKWQNMVRIAMGK